MNEGIEFRKRAAHDLLDEIVTELQGWTSGDDPAMDSRRLMRLVEQNFDRLDADGDGISRGELTVALARRSEFSPDEYVMLYLLGKYFDMIAEMSDDQPGEQDIVITKTDKNILGQFLVNNNLTLAQLNEWFARSRKVS